MYRNQESNFSEERNEFFQEHSSFYSRYPADMSLCNSRIEEFCRQSPAASPYSIKSCIYKTAAELCEVHLFRYDPFYYEIISGRRRNSGTSGFPPEDCIGAWMMRKNSYIAEEYRDWYEPYTGKDIIDTIMYVDFAHHCAGYDTVLKKGISGILEEAQDALKNTEDQEKQDFLRSVIAGNKALAEICIKFSDKAMEMLSSEQDETVRKRLVRIADTAKRVPFEPPKSFYEALNTILLIREAGISLDGIAVAILGQLDRMLERFYLSDYEKGLLTRDEAKDLLARFLAITDARFDYTNSTNGANISITIGGCDGEGRPVFNEVTKMIIEIYREYKLVNPKLQARVSKNHSAEYIGMLSSLVASAANVLSILNDDVIIPSQTAMGKSIEDCRIYAAGGCQEPILQNTEVNCRAYFYLNLLQVLRMALLPEQFEIFEREGIAKPDGQWQTFEDFYNECLSLLKKLCGTFASRLNGFEARWSQYSPCPLFSSAIEGCIKSGKDITAGGAKYNNSSIALVGIASFIDSLYAVKKAVFDDGFIDMGSMKKALDNSFSTDEVLRLYLSNHIEKFGQDTEDINRFAKKVFGDVASNSSGMANSRGGTFEASLFTFFAYDWLKDYTGATPDGRLAGQRLSRGISPAESAKDVNIGKILHTVKELDLTKFPGSGVLYLDMPVSVAENGSGLYGSIIESAVNAGIIALDFNITNREALIKAKKDPGQYRNLVVRVCGYSAYFTGLDAEVQDEIIERMYR